MKKIIGVYNITVRYKRDNTTEFKDKVAKRINDIQSGGNSAEIKYSTFCDSMDFYQSALILEIKGE